MLSCSSEQEGGINNVSQPDPLQLQAYPRTVPHSDHNNRCESTNNELVAECQPLECPQNLHNGSDDASTIACAVSAKLSFGN
ncbi:unnamed protein product [Phytophthora lilii]|uniref:Unnamed protein product n=1 Tax=Phytophthora lilii TaxID=2077276 RepID=A0A9W6TAM1_9STRA|nr:unnamed protein product [Phytophthora lilii]